MKYTLSLPCITAAVLLSSCSPISVNNNITIGLKYEKQTVTDCKPDIGKNTDSLVFSYDAGCCIINAGAETAGIASDVTVKGSTQEIADKIAGSLYISTDIKDNALNVTLCSGLNEGQDVWHFIKNGEYASNASVSADTVFDLPDSISFIDIEDGAGEIELNGFSGKAKLETGAGDVTVRSSVLTGATEIDTGAGSISIDLAGAPELGSMLDISTGVGDIELSLPGSLNEDTVIELNTGVGSITLDTGGLEYTVDKEEGAITAHQVEITIGGKCTVRMSTGAGDIDIKEPSALDK